MAESYSKFNITTNREVFLFGDPSQVSMLQQVLKSLPFLDMKDGKEFLSHRPDMHFLVGAVDFEDTRQLQDIAKLFSQSTSTLAHKILYARSPDQLETEHMLFAQEIGTRFVARGAERSTVLKEYMKRICVETQSAGSLEGFEKELEAAHARGDQGTIRGVIERLKAKGAEGDDCYRLLAVANIYVKNFSRAEFYLKQLLRLNNQNLWAANHLGRLYLSSGRVDEGIDMLERMSQFHELNSERCLKLGDAYLLSGQLQQARESYEKGDQLSGGEDERFKTGLAKVELATGHFQEALSVLGRQHLSLEIIAFLNMRAIMHIKQGRLEEGLNCYEQAITGAGDQNDIKAKLYFNMGLALARSDDLDGAETCLKQSVSFGGEEFPRARGPLEIVQAARKAHAQGGGVAGQGRVDLGRQLEWETLY